MTQAHALELLKTGRNVFITGPAGSGKTHLVNQYIAYLREHDIDVGITASTGIAATHMGGVTIHSWAGIGVAASLSVGDIEALSDKAYLRRRFERVKVLIIDEVSMLHHFRFDLVNKVLKALKKNDLPFGGIQVVLCGDFFQLPPVSTLRDIENGLETHFIYKSESWKEANFTVCYLSEQFRQKEGEDMLSILNEIRRGDVSEGSYDLLASRHLERLGENTDRAIRDIEPTRLFTHNADVDAINDAELDGLESLESSEYRMDSSGRDALVATLKKSCLAPELLRLKIGARVMCVKNNFEEGYVNGTLGVVVSCKKDHDPVIRTAKGDVVTIERASWKITEDDKVLAEISQYPLRLAWAITVHKSQGMSLDAVEVDLSKSFAPGMGYVALSRVRTLEGLVIRGMNSNALGVSEEALEFDMTLRRLSDDTDIDPETITREQKEFLKRAEPTKEEKELSTFEKTRDLLSQKMGLEDMARERGVTTETIVAHIEKLLEAGEGKGGEKNDLDISYLKYEISSAHWKKIEKAIHDIVESQGDTVGEKGLLLSPVKNKVGANVSFLHIRLARAILGYGPKI